MSQVYKVTQEEIDRQQEEFWRTVRAYKPFHLTGEQISSLGKRYYNSLMTQDYETRLHDYPIDGTNNKPRKYLSKYPPGTKVLLLGVGVGREVICAQEMGLDAYGITIGYHNVCFGREILGIEEKRLVEGCIDLLPYVSEIFDVVAGFQILEHAIAPMMILLEQSRVLREGGRIILEWPPASGHSTNGKDPQHQVCFTPGQAEGLLLKAGFGDVKLFYVDMSPIPEEAYWDGGRIKGYVIVTATKIECSEKYIQNARKTLIE